MKYVFITAIIAFSACKNGQYESSTYIVPAEEREAYSKELKLLEQLKDPIVVKISQTEKGLELIKSLKDRGFKINSIAKGSLDDSKRTRTGVYTLYFMQSDKIKNPDLDDPENDTENFRPQSHSNESDAANFRQIVPMTEPTYTYGYALQNVSENEDEDLFRPLNNGDDSGTPLDNSADGTATIPVEVQFDRVLTSKESLDQAKIIDLKLKDQITVYAALR